MCVFAYRQRLANQSDRDRKMMTKTCLYLRSSLVKDDLHIQDGSKLLLGGEEEGVLLIKRTDWGVWDERKGENEKEM